MNDGCFMGEVSRDSQPQEKARRELLEKIRGLNPGDRLDAVNACYACVKVIHDSVAIWWQLLTNPSITCRLDKELLSEIFARLRELVERHVELEVSMAKSFAQRKIRSRPGT